MDDTIDDFKMILERKKKYKLTQISKFLSPNPAAAAAASSSQKAASSTSQDSSFLNNSKELLDESLDNQDHEFLTTKERGSSKPSLAKLNSSVFSTQALSTQQKPESKPSTLTTKKPTNSKSRSSKLTPGDSSQTRTISKYFNTSQSSPDLSQSQDTSCLKFSQIEEPEPPAKFACPLCSFDLTSYGDSERQLHVNKCLDKGFSSTKAVKEKKEETTASAKVIKLEPAKMAIEHSSAVPTTSSTNEPPDRAASIDSMLKEIVPNCPICGKVLNSFSIRQSHLKKCATTFNINTNSLVDLVKKQEEKLERDLAQGLIPDDVHFLKSKKKDNSKPKKTKITNRVIKMETPVNQEDEQFQMAVAMSNSLDPKAASSLLTEKQQSKLSKKEQLAVKAVSVLSNHEERALIASQRFSIILLNQINYIDLDLAAAPLKDSRYRVFRLAKTKYSASSNYLWDMCKYFDEGVQSFYIDLLRLGSTKYVVGDRLFIDPPPAENKFENIEIINTQTAFLLADLNNQTQAPENVSLYCTQLQVTSNEKDEHEEQQEFGSVEPDQSVFQFQTQMVKASFERHDDQEEEEYGEEEHVFKRPADITMSSKQVDQSIVVISDDDDDSNGQTAKSTVSEILIEDSSSNSSNSKDVTLTAQQARVSYLFERAEPKEVVYELTTEDTDSNHSSSPNPGAKAAPELIVDETKLSTSKEEEEEDDHGDEPVADEVNSDQEDDEDDVLNANVEEFDSFESKSGLETSHSNAVNADKPAEADQDESSVQEMDHPEPGFPSNQSLLNESSSRSKKRKSIDLVNLVDLGGGVVESKDADDDDLVVAAEIRFSKHARLLEEPDEEEKEEASEQPPASRDHDLGHQEPQPDYDADLDFVWNNFSECQPVDDYMDENDDPADPEPTNSGNNEITPPTTSFKSPPAVTKSHSFVVNDEDDDDDGEVSLASIELEATGKADGCMDESMLELELLKKNEAQIDILSSQSSSSKHFNRTVLAEKQPAFETCDDEDDSIAVKTPVVQNRAKNKVIDGIKDTAAAAAAINLTPMPSYDAMNTPVLKDQLKSYGVKALPKRQAIKKLVEIYQYTHRHKIKAVSLQRSQSCFDFTSSSASTAASSSKPDTRTTSPPAKTTKTTKTTTTTSKMTKTKTTIGLSSLHELTAAPTFNKAAAASSKRAFGGDDSSDTDDQAGYGSLDEAADIMNMNNKPPKAGSKPSKKEPKKPASKTKKKQAADTVDDDDQDAATTPTKRASKQLSEDELRTMVANLVKNDPEVHLNVLNYIPLDFEELCNQLAENAKPKKVNKKTLMKMLDEVCVTFTLKNINSHWSGAKNKLKSNKKH